MFDPEGWAYQFGLRWPVARKLRFEQRFIGIEIASEGALVESDGQLYCFDRISDRTRKPAAEAYDHGTPYRGYRYFDRYEEPQIETLIALVNELCDRFAIPRRIPDRFLDYYGEQLESFEGVIGHNMVRPDKTDPLPDPAFWQRVVDGCGLTPVSIGAPHAAAVPVAAGTAAPAAAHAGAATTGGAAAAAGAAPVTDAYGPAAAARASGASGAAARATAPTPAPAAASAAARDVDIEALHRHNAEQLNRMNVAAAGVVSALLDELERAGRRTYIRLDNAAERGHTVDYTLVRGDRALVARVARAGLRERDRSPTGGET